MALGPRYALALRGLYASAGEAHGARENFGADYIVRHGSLPIGTDRFEWWREDDHD